MSIKQPGPVLMKHGILSFLAVLACLQQVGGLVLCKGEDGHLEIELSQQGACVSCLIEDEHDDPSRGFSVEKDHCGNCVDVALSPSLAVKHTYSEAFFGERCFPVDPGTEAPTSAGHVEFSATAAGNISCSDRDQNDSTDHLNLPETALHPTVLLPRIRGFVCLNQNSIHPFGGFLMLRYLFYGTALSVLAGCAVRHVEIERVASPELGRDFTAFTAPAEPLPREKTPVPVRKTLSVREALALTLLHGPELAAYAYEIRAREALELQAGVLPNPEAVISIENFGGETGFNGTNAAETTLLLGQHIETRR